MRVLGIIVFSVIFSVNVVAQIYPQLTLKGTFHRNEFGLYNRDINKLSLSSQNRINPGFFAFKDTIESQYGSQRKLSPGRIEFDAAYKHKKNYWLPGLEVIGLNYGIWAFDHYVTDAPWANISIQSIKQNFQKMWIWDHDFFITNQFAHPYHGNLYFNFARSSGLTFWESAPYSFGGSLMWELFMETNYPSRNDLINTTLGGIALGEMTYRLSSLVIDERKTGFARVLSEIGAFVIAPTRAFNRFIKGDISRVRQKSIYEIEPVSSSVSIGPSYVWEKSGIYKGSGNFSVKIDLYYGNPYEQRSRKPFDFFNVKALFGFGAQPFINQVSVYGLLFGKNYSYTSNQKMLIGAFQHYDFFNNKYYKIAGQSLGGGVIYQLPNIGNTKVETSIHLAAIVLGGGSNPPEVWAYEPDSSAFRDYNFGMGFTTKFETILSAKFGYMFLGFNLFRIFTISGAEGNDQLLSIYPRLVVRVTKQLNFGLEYNFYLRNSNYKKYPDIYYRTNELKFLVSTRF